MEAPASGSEWMVATSTHRTTFRNYGNPSIFFFVPWEKQIIFPVVIDSLSHQQFFFLSKWKDTITFVGIYVGESDHSRVSKAMQGVLQKKT